MEKMKYCIYSVLLIISASACGERSEDVRYESIKLASDNLIIDDEILNPTSIIIVDDLLFIYEGGITDSIFKLIHIGTNELIHSFGVIGDGPGEYSDNISMPVKTYGDKSELSLYDWLKKQVHRFQIQPYEDDFGRISYVLPPELIMAQRAAFINDTIIVASGGMAKGAIAFININTDEVTYFNPYTLDDKVYAMRDLMQLYRSDFTINFINNRIAVSSFYLPQIYILDHAGNLITTINENDKNTSELLNSDFDTLPIHIHDIASTEHYFYTVNIGVSTNQLLSYYDADAIPDSLTEIRKYDWNGQLQQKFTLDKGFHPFITIDADNNRILTIDRFSSSNNILYYYSDLIE